MSCTTSSNSSGETGDSSTSLSLSLCRSEGDSDFGPSSRVISLPDRHKSPIRLWNFDFLERIIRLNLENNWKTFQEVRNRIFGKILSITASSLVQR